MKVLIIGASGLVGSNCLRYFKQKEIECVGTYFSYEAKDTVFFDTLNLHNHDNFDVASFKPDVILHCGALTHVDYCEHHKAHAKRTLLITHDFVPTRLSDG